MRIKNSLTKKDISFCMIMENEFIWEIKTQNPPLLQRKCSHCSSDRFYCSEKFRMNAQKRNIDVWLIYRCVQCNNTCNITILSRTKPELIPKDLFHDFSTNNKATAWKYAFSPETGRKNNIEQDYKSVKYEIVHDIISIEDTLSIKNEVIVFRIKSEFEFGLKLSSVIRTCLGISVNQFSRMLEKEIISIPTTMQIKKHKVKDGDLILIHRTKLQKYVERERII